MFFLIEVDLVVVHKNGEKKRRKFANVTERARSCAVFMMFSLSLYFTQLAL